MGHCFTKETSIADLQRAKDRSRELDLANQKAHLAERAVSKLLLLGAGESGKSTLFKQMITIYGTGFPEGERMTYQSVIYNNIVTMMQTLVASCAFHGSPVSCRSSFEYVRGMPGEEKISAANVNHFQALWADKGIQKTYENRSKFQLPDSACYFFDNLDRIAAEGYIPSEQDVLRCRVRTTGITESSFAIEGNKFKLFDVGGQRNERKKWIHCFESVTAVLFVGVLSEYDLKLFEDEKMNRMEETLNLFDEICNSRWFHDTAIILFLNKCDVFEVKIKKVPLTACPLFSNYQGENTFEAGCELIEQAFHAKNRNTEKTIYAHVTCATDTSNVATVFNAAKEIIISMSLDEAGLKNLS